MPTLEELLRASLKGANEKFDQANNALHAAVVEAALAVDAVTKGKAALYLYEVDKDESLTRYSVDIQAKGSNEFRTLATFAVPKTGFPISRHEKERVGTIEKFDSKESLSAYFQKLASDPDSPLIAYLAYIVRNNPEPPDPIPF